jgi:hypothetical protein
LDESSGADVQCLPGISEVKGSRCGGGSEKLKGPAAPASITMPSPVSPESILDDAPTGSRVLKVDANVIAYFGDYFHAFRTGLMRYKKPTVTQSNLFQNNPVNTASVQNPS